MLDTAVSIILPKVSDFANAALTVSSSIFGKSFFVAKFLAVIFASKLLSVITLAVFNLFAILPVVFSSPSNNVVTRPDNEFKSVFFANPEFFNVFAILPVVFSSPSNNVVTRPDNVSKVPLAAKVSPNAFEMAALFVFLVSSVLKSAVLKSCNVAALSFDKMPRVFKSETIKLFTSLVFVNESPRVFTKFVLLTESADA